MSDSIQARVDGAVGFVEIDRPQRANAYTTAMLDAIEAGVQRHVADDGVRVIVVGSATPGRFCAGADLDEIHDRGIEDALELRALAVFDGIAEAPVPTLAAIDGPAFGGGLELALACDLRIATPRARFALPETGFGVLPAAGATFRLPALVGPGVARELILFGGELDGGGAAACGLVNELVQPHDLGECVAGWCASAARRDPLATRLATRAMALSVADCGGREFARCAQGVLYERLRGRDRRDDTEDPA
jgi:enoyl-CoA hydratase